MVHRHIQEGTFLPGSLLKEDAAHMAANGTINCFPRECAIKFGFKESSGMVIADAQQAEDQEQSTNESSEYATASENFANDYVKTKNFRYDETLDGMNNFDNALHIEIQKPS